MRFFYYTTALVIISILSCCKDPGASCAPDRDEFYKINAQEKAVLPYHGHDTIRLKHSSGNTATFYGQGLDSSYNINGESTSPDCATNIFQHRQFYKINFASPNYSLPLQVRLESAKAYAGALLKSVLNKNVVFYTDVLLDFPPPHRLSMIMIPSS